MFSGIDWNQPVGLSVHVCVCVCACPSVCKKKNSFCQSAGEGIKAHVVTALFIAADVDVFAVVIAAAAATTI